MKKFVMPKVEATVDQFMDALRKNKGISTRGFVRAMGGSISTLSAMQIAHKAQKKYGLASRWIPIHGGTSQESFYEEKVS